MEPGNRALNLLQKIILIVENYVSYHAQHLEQMQVHNQAGKNYFIDKKIEELSEKLIFWIDKHEELTNKSAELLQHLESIQHANNDMQRATNLIFFKLKDLELINKDALFWKQKAEFMESTRKIIFNEYIKLKNAQENNQHRGC